MHKKVIKKMRAILLFTLTMISHAVFADNNAIVPEDKAQLHRVVGESVYVECKKAGPFSTNCQVNCGNGMRFQKASGYCYYLRSGVFILNVNTRYRSKELFHTATVTVEEKTHFHGKVPNDRSVLNPTGPTAATGSVGMISMPGKTISGTTVTFSGGNRRSVSEGTNVTNTINLNSIATQQSQNQIDQSIEKKFTNLNANGNLNSFSQANANLNNNSNLTNGVATNQINNNNQNLSQYSAR